MDEEENVLIDDHYEIKFPRTKQNTAYIFQVNKRIRGEFTKYNIRNDAGSILIHNTLIQGGV